MNRRRMEIRRREAEGRMWVRFGREIAMTRLVAKHHRTRLDRLDDQVRALRVGRGR